jgi:hypothetical protein
MISRYCSFSTGLKTTMSATIHSCKRPLTFMASSPASPRRLAAVALANKTARMAWARLLHEIDYDPDFAMS